LDNYLYSVKSSLNDPEKLKGKLSSSDQSTVEDALKDGQSFLDENPDAEKDQYDEKRK
jgi:heat shock protein 5